MQAFKPSPSADEVTLTKSPSNVFSAKAAGIGAAQVAAGLADGTTIDKNGPGGTLELISLPTGLVRVNKHFGLKRTTADGSNTTQFHPYASNLDAIASAETVEANVESVCAVAAIVDALRARNITATVAAGTIVLTLRKNSADTTLTVTWGNGVAAETAMADLVDSVTFAAGDRVCWKNFTTGVAEPASVKGGTRETY